MNYPAASSGELTPQRSEIRTRCTTDFQRSIRKKEIAQKMLREMERKKKLPEFEPDNVQHWFKPVIAIYLLWRASKT